MVSLEIKGYDGTISTSIKIYKYNGDGVVMQVISELFYYMKKNIIISLFMFICVAVAVLLSSFTSLIVHEAELDLDKYTEIYNDGHYYGIGDKFYNQTEDVLMSKDNYVEILKGMNQWLHNNGIFEYYEGREDYIYLKQMNTMMPAGEYNQMKAFFLGPEDLEHFEISVDDGKMLDKNDFVHTKEMSEGMTDSTLAEVKILLGSSMRKKYNVGDTFEVNNIFFKGIARVKGFLKEKSAIVNNNGDMITLDGSVVFPFFNEFSGYEDMHYMRILYLQKNSGKIYTKLSNNDVQEIINEYTSSLGIAGAYFVFGATNQWQPVFAQNLSSTVENLKKVAGGITLFSALALGLYLFVRISRSVRYFGILLLNGFTLVQIKVMILSEVLIILVMALFSGVALSELIRDLNYPEYDMNYFSGLIPIILIGMFATLCALYSFGKRDISISVKGD